MKSPLATEVFNLARYHIPPAKMSAKTQREVGKYKLMFKTSLVESAIFIFVFLQNLYHYEL